MNRQHAWLKRSPIAHRGLHDGTSEIVPGVDSKEIVAENSIPSFEAAIQHGYPIELDIQMIKDSTIVVFHDKSLKRVCGKKGKVTKLKKEDLGNYHLFLSDAVIPTLKEVLEVVDGRTPLLIELKNFSLFNRSLEKGVLAMLDNYKGPFAIMAFNPFSVKWMKKRRKDFCIGQLATTFGKPKLLGWLANNIFLSKKTKADFVAFDVKDLPNKRVTYFKQLRKPILGWTVLSQATQNQVSGTCDNIIFEDFVPNTGTSK